MLRSSSTASSSSISTQRSTSEIIQLLESKNISVIEETSSLVRDSLNSSPDPWLLNGLVDYYIATGNVLVRQLLTSIRQPQHKNLLGKLDEYLQKPSSRYAALNLFGHVVRKDPVWIHHLVKSHAFGNILKYLLQDNDVAFLTNALYVVVTLLPKVPTRIGSNLNHLFAIFVRLASWMKSKSQLDDVNTAHFETALYAFFLCLYGMYPGGFITYLQQNYCRQANSDSRGSNASHTAAVGDPVADAQRYEVFREIVLPMLQRVRLHPNLILYTKELEILNEKWRKTECHDVVAEICQMRLDDRGHISSICGRAEEVRKDADSVPSGFSVLPVRVDPPLQTVDGSKHDGSESSSTIWSPSMEIGLSTPPPSRSISPSRDIGEQKLKYDNSKGPQSQTSQDKARPGTLNLSASLLRENSNSTPSTPTLGSFGFEFEKSDVATKVDAVLSDPKERKVEKAETVPSLSASTGISSRNSLCLSSPLPEEAFVDICREEEGGVLSVAPGEHITDFSPALQPSLEQVSVTNVPVTTSAHAQDSLFESSKLKVKDILCWEMAGKITCADTMHKELDLAADNCDRRYNYNDVDWVGMQGVFGEMSHSELRSACLQMHCTLLYERHLREQHATRARRLMRKVYEFSALEQKNEALQRRLEDKDNEIYQYQLSAKSSLAEIHKREETLRETATSCENKIAALTKELQNITAENNKLKLCRENDAQVLKEVNNNLKTTQSDLYRSKLHLQCESKNKETIQGLNSQVVQLQKELLVVKNIGSTLSSVSQGMDQFKRTEMAHFKSLLESYKQEQMKLKSSLKEKSVSCDALTGKCREMEKLVEKKNCLLVEQKKYLENVKSLARSQIQAMESKYQTQKAITMRMEVQVMELYSLLTALEGRVPADSLTQSESKPIQQQHPHGFQLRYGHLTKASPELSPPIKVNPLAESSVATSELEASAAID